MLLKKIFKPVFDSLNSRDLPSPGLRLGRACISLRLQVLGPFMIDNSKSESESGSLRLRPGYKALASEPAGPDSETLMPPRARWAAQPRLQGPGRSVLPGDLGLRRPCGGSGADAAEAPVVWVPPAWQEAAAWSL